MTKIILTVCRDTHITLLKGPTFLVRRELLGTEVGHGEGGVGVTGVGGIVQGGGCDSEAVPEGRDPQQPRHRPTGLTLLPEQHHPLQHTPFYVKDELKVVNSFLNQLYEKRVRTFSCLSVGIKIVAIGKWVSPIL